MYIYILDIHNKIRKYIDKLSSPFKQYMYVYIYIFMNVSNLK